MAKANFARSLRSATDGKADHTTARRRLGAVGASRVESFWASGATIAYGAGKSNGCLGQIHIFDQEYISKNLHVGDSVTHENKRSLLPIVLTLRAWRSPTRSPLSTSNRVRSSGIAMPKRDERTAGLRISNSGPERQG